jgi:acyl carrier protein
MQTHTTHNQIVNFITKHFPSVRNRIIESDDPLLENGILDSLGVLELVNYIEKEFGINISDEDLVPEHFQTTKHITAFIQMRKAAQP